MNNSPFSLQKISNRILLFIIPFPILSTSLSLYVPLRRFRASFHEKRMFSLLMNGQISLQFTLIQTLLLRILGKYISLNRKKFPICRITIALYALLEGRTVGPSVIISEKGEKLHSMLLSTLISI